MEQNVNPVCACCGSEFRPKRPWQRHCSMLGQNRVAIKRHNKAITSKRGASRSSKSHYKAPAPLLQAHEAPQRREFTPGPTPGALQGDDYPLEYYEDGYPKLPSCLDRRKPKSESVAA